MSPAVGVPDRDFPTRSSRSRDWRSVLPAREAEEARGGRALTPRRMGVGLSRPLEVTPPSHSERTGPGEEDGAEPAPKLGGFRGVGGRKAEELSGRGFANGLRASAPSCPSGRGKGSGPSIAWKACTAIALGSPAKIPSTSISNVGRGTLRAGVMLGVEGVMRGVEGVAGVGVLRGCITPFPFPVMGVWGVLVESICVNKKVHYQKAESAQR